MKIVNCLDSWLLRGGHLLHCTILTYICPSHYARNSTKITSWLRCTRIRDRWICPRSRRREYKLTKSCIPRISVSRVSPRRSDRCHSASFDLPLFHSQHSIDTHRQYVNTRSASKNIQFSNNFRDILIRIYFWSALNSSRLLLFRTNKANLTMRGNDETPLDAVTGAIATAVDRYVIDKRTAESKYRRPIFTVDSYFKTVLSNVLSRYCGPLIRS